MTLLLRAALIIAVIAYLSPARVPPDTVGAPQSRGIADADGRSLAHRAEAAPGPGKHGEVPEDLDKAWSLLPESARREMAALIAREVARSLPAAVREPFATEVAAPKVAPAHRITLRPQTTDPISHSDAPSPRP